MDNNLLYEAGTHSAVVHTPNDENYIWLKNKPVTNILLLGKNAPVSLRAFSPMDRPESVDWMILNTFDFECKQNQDGTYSAKYISSIR